MESLKYTKKETEVVLTLLGTFKKWQPIVNQIKIHNFGRKEVGLLMRETRQLWLASMTMALLDDLGNSTDSEVSKVVDLWVQLKNQIEAHQLVGVWELKPFFDGKQIIQMLHLKAGGIIGKIIQEQVCWQLQNPHATQEDCTNWLKQQNFL